MSDEIVLKDGYEREEVRSLIDRLRDMVDLEDGELYTLRKQMLHRVARSDDDNGLRRIKIMEDAYDAATVVAKRLRKRMRGYRPDPALVISAFVLHAARLKTADDIAIEYLQWLFSRIEPDADLDSKSIPDGQPVLDPKSSADAGRGKGVYAHPALTRHHPSENGRQLCGSCLNGK
ncbi:MAG: hypothetical protein WAW42_12970 [Candidatus Competibacteraceae bacterium]